MLKRKSQHLWLLRSGVAVRPPWLAKQSVTTAADCWGLLTFTLASVLSGKRKFSSGLKTSEKDISIIQMRLPKLKKKHLNKFFGELMKGAGGSPASILCFLPRGCLQGHGHYDPRWQLRLHNDLEAAFTSTAHRVCSNALLFRFINNRGGGAVSGDTHLAPQNPPVRTKQLL